MKILWIYKGVPDADFDHFFHVDLARWISKQPGYELKLYGTNLYNKNKDIALIYNSDFTLEKIHRNFQFDVIICNTKCRMFDFYLPPKAIGNTKGEQRKGCLLPPDFATFNCKKIMIEEDYHYETSDAWYREQGFNVVLQRHWSNWKQQQERGEMKSLWYPFSVDEKVFKISKPFTERESIAVNLGSASSNYYLHRVNAIKTLENANIGYDYGSHYIDKDYVEALQKYKIVINGSCIFDIAPAKMMEITASGALMLTNEGTGYGLQELFPEGSYLTYKPDCSDIVNKVKQVFNGKINGTEITKKARQHVLENHTNDIRLAQLKQIVEEL